MRCRNHLLTPAVAVLRTTTVAPGRRRADVERSFDVAYGAIWMRA